MSRFDDIINHKYVKSPLRMNMSLTERAAQFGAFRAVTGHEDALVEVARYTEERIEPDEYEKQEISRVLNFLAEHIDSTPCVTIGYFVPDKKKQGGKHMVVNGELKKILIEQRVVVVGECRIPIDDIILIRTDFIDKTEAVDW